MSAGALLAVALVLAVERVAYVLVWRHPRAFAAWCARVPGLPARSPVAALERLFWAFKALQLGVFAYWCWSWSGGAWPRDLSPLGIAVGIVLVAVGQTLNLAVFYRLGRSGVFYGNRFGHSLPWCERFPFSVLEHPQYVGAVLSIWGLFLIVRYPHPDWPVLPLLETVYYAVGSRLER